MTHILDCFKQPEFYAQYSDKLYDGYKLYIDPETGYVNMTDLFNNYSNIQFKDICHDGDFWYHVHEIAYDMAVAHGLDTIDTNYADSLYFKLDDDSMFMHPCMLEYVSDQLEPSF